MSLTCRPQYMHFSALPLLRKIKNYACKSLCIQYSIQFLLHMLFFFLSFQTLWTVNLNSKFYAAPTLWNKEGSILCTAMYIVTEDPGSKPDQIYDRRIDRQMYIWNLRGSHTQYSYTAHTTHAALQSHSALHTTHMPLYSLTLHCTQHTCRSTVSLCTAHNTPAALRQAATSPNLYNDVILPNVLT